MLSTCSPTSKLVLGPKSTSPNASTTLDDFLRSLTRDPNRLTYRNYHLTKSAELPNAPKEDVKAPQCEGSDRFLPLLPLLTLAERHKEHNNLSSENENATASATAEAAEQQRQEPIARSRSRPSRAIIVYSRKTRKSPLPQAENLGWTSNRSSGLELEESSDNENVVVEDEHTAQREENTPVKEDVPRKRKQRKKSVVGKDSPGVVGKTPLRKRQRRRQLPARELAMVKDIPSSSVSEDKSGEHGGINQLEAADPIETQRSLQAFYQRRSNQSIIPEPKPAEKLRRSLKGSTAERISPEDFKFPVTTATPQKGIVTDWTPGSGFSGLPSDFTSKESSGKHRRPKVRHPDPLVIRKLKVTKILSSRIRSDVSTNSGKKRAKYISLGNKNNTLFAKSAAHSLDLAGQLSADEAPGAIGGPSLPEASTPMNEQCSPTKSNRVAEGGSQDRVDGALDSQIVRPQANSSSLVAHLPPNSALQRERSSGRVTTIALHKKPAEKAQDVSSEAKVSKTPTLQSQDYPSDKSEINTKLRGGEGSILHRSRALYVPHLAHLHPPYPPFQRPPNEPHESGSPSEEEFDKAEKQLVEAGEEMLDWEMQPILPRASKPLVGALAPNLADQSSHPQHHMRSRSLSASTPSICNLTPSSRSTDPRARLEIVDSQGHTAR